METEIKEIDLSGFEAEVIEKVTAKLQAEAAAKAAKEAELEADLACAKNEQKKSRLERKIRIAREQIARAKWLMGEIVPKPSAE